MRAALALSMLIQTCQIAYQDSLSSSRPYATSNSGLYPCVNIGHPHLQHAFQAPGPSHNALLNTDFALHHGVLCPVRWEALRSSSTSEASTVVLSSLASHTLGDRAAEPFPLQALYTSRREQPSLAIDSHCRRRRRGANANR
ncbi:hypothetical protein BD311DRAFT_754267 [Dichomitus squalens]|uniref:Secreted protein n=1 Tax=Dichomitus squalens TaxID=114155 RepID=A0A4Q9MSF0_9APHY|nr:hypothetical protein BD311DRAFT_754267 [Dichomitus squalens]